jgi:hypothetical protein
MFSPGGTAQQGAVARKRLDAAMGVGMWAGLAVGVIDDAHGNPQSAAEGYVHALAAASTSPEPSAPLVAWFAVRHLMALRGAVTDLYLRHRVTFEPLLEKPGHIGWRAVSELEDWRALEVYDKAELVGSAYDDEVVRRMGCSKNVRLAGPFGHGVAADALRSFPAEWSGPWPSAWPPDPARGTIPHTLAVTQKRCMAIAKEQVEEGVFYAETFFRTDGERELLVAVQGAIAVWIDGTQVLRRSASDWGSWQRFGAHVSVPKGRHRILARTVTAGASVRLLNPDGTPAGFETDGDPTPPVGLEPPRLLSDPNPIDAQVRALVAGGSTPFASSPVRAALAAYAAHSDQLDDVASAIVEPLALAPNAAAGALEMASLFAAADPALPDDARGTRSRTLRDRAIDKDPRLWRPRAGAIMESAEQHGLAESVDALRSLSEEVRGEPELLEHLANLYGRLGWRGQRLRALTELCRRFPDDVGALQAYLDVLDDEGPPAEADRVAARVRALDPDSEVDLQRALSRHDYAAAIAELNRLGARRPEQKEIANRIADVLARSGKPKAAADALQEALLLRPLDAEVRFRVADRAYAAGETNALRQALASCLQARASCDALRTAIDLIEGATDLESYRHDGRAVIRDFQGWEKSGHHKDGTAARVLDYAATWVHSDGSSEMLEHEIQKLQSQEAVTSESEMEPPSGLVLHLRVIKPDGHILEPEPISGKPTVTLPHLEVGDFVELEHLTRQTGDGSGGKHYQGPHWFFREADKGYWRSEFVVVTPADRQLIIETRGSVPPPSTTQVGNLVERRWRVDQSPPAQLEPESAPIQEFLPSVRIGWGISLDTALGRLVDLAADTTPLDPRLRALALGVVGSAPPSAKDQRARGLYRWVLTHVQEGKETDGRRVLTGGSGSRQAAFRYMLRLLGIESSLSVVKDPLAMPSLGPMSEIDAYDALVIRVATESGDRWLTIHDKFAPYGYVPSELRGAPSILLVEGTPRSVVKAPASADEIAYGGRADVRQDGSASLALNVTFQGGRAIAWRGALEQVAQARLYDFVEREVIAPSFDGGHVREVKIDAADEPDQPLVMHLRVDVPELAKPSSTGLSLHPPFSPSLSQLATLPVRRSPMLRRASWRTAVRMQVVLPDAMKLPARLPHAEYSNGRASVRVRDSVSGHAIDFEREIDLPAGRVEPGHEYAAWQAFVRDADTVLTRDVAIGK